MSDAKVQPCSLLREYRVAAHAARGYVGDVPAGVLAAGTMTRVVILFTSPKDTDVVHLSNLFEVLVYISELHTAVCASCTLHDTSGR